MLYPFLQWCKFDLINYSNKGCWSHCKREERPRSGCDRVLIKNEESPCEMANKTRRTAPRQQSKTKEKEEMSSR